MVTAIQLLRMASTDVMPMPVSLPTSAGTREVHLRKGEELGNLKSHVHMHHFHPFVFALWAWNTNQREGLHSTKSCSTLIYNDWLYTDTIWYCILIILICYCTRLILAPVRSCQLHRSWTWAIHCWTSRSLMIPRPSELASNGALVVFKAWFWPSPTVEMSGVHSPVLPEVRAHTSADKPSHDLVSFAVFAGWTQILYIHIIIIYIETIYMIP